jgi:hypothetical protein
VPSSASIRRNVGQAVSVLRGGVVMMLVRYLTEYKSTAGPIESAPTQINVCLSQPAIVPPARDLALAGLSAAFAG